jgi:hypothetical protein
LLTENGGAFGNAPGSTYNWYEGGCGTGSSLGSATTLSLTPTTGVHTYYVRIEDACGNTSCVSVAITVLSAPPTTAVIVPPIIGLPSYACNGTTASISIPIVPTATQYIWDGPTGTTFNGGFNPYTASSPTANITFGNANSSGYYIGVQAANACGSTIRKVQWVRGIVSVPTAVSGAATVCANSVHTYSTSAVGGATSYSWYAPAGFSITDGTNTGNPLINTTSTSVTVTASATFTGASTGSICVTANTPCYSSPQKCLTISSAQSVLGQMSGVFTVCPGTPQTYMVPSAGPGTYAWTLPPNASGSSTTNSITVSFATGFTSGNISVVYTNECGQSSPARVKSAVSGVPSQPASISGSTNGLCNQTTVFTCPAQPTGVSFNWTKPTGATGSSISNSISIHFPAAAFTGTVCVSATNSCGTSTQRCVSVKGAPNTPGAIVTTPSSWCSPTSGIDLLSSTSGLGGSYSLNWTWLPVSAANYVVGQGTNNLTLDWINSGTATVYLTTSNACGSGTKTLSLNIAPCTQNRAGSTNYNVSDNAKFSVYPNPASEIINVDFESVTKEDVQLQLTDMSGRTLITKSVNSIEGFNHHTLDISKLAKGVYMLNLKSADNIFSVRVVVQ